MEGIMEGTVKQCKELGYTDEQANVLGRLDFIMEEAQKVGLIDSDGAYQVGRIVGRMFGEFTGILS